jgi:hypothetical protein
MRHWTRGAVVAAMLFAISGCVAGMRLVATENGIAPRIRPHASYYCYDCHGYRFFDPYYDWCAYYGFRYAWAGHPEAVAIYRERYPRIKEGHPDYGRYRYRGDYRASRRYREPRDFESWRSGQGAEVGGRPRVRDNRHGGQGSEQDKKRRERKGPRGNNPLDSMREGV